MRPSHGRSCPLRARNPRGFLEYRGEFLEEAKFPREQIHGSLAEKLKGPGTRGPS